MPKRQIHDPGVFSPYACRFWGKTVFRIPTGLTPDIRTDLKSLKRVLVIRTDEIGDVVLSAAFFRELRRNLPAARITLLVSRASANWVQTCPYSDEILTIPSERIKENIGSAGILLRSIFFALKVLRPKRFDAVLIPRKDVDFYHAGLMAFFSGAPLRVGYTEGATPKKMKYNNGYDFFLTRVVESERLSHAAEEGLDLLRALGGTIGSDHPESWLTRQDEETAGKFLAARSISPGSPLVGMGPCARQPKRQWPAERFIKIGRWLTGELGMNVVLLGGPGEEARGRTIREAIGPGAFDAVGTLTLREAAAVLKKCVVYIGNDSALMHLASTQGVPVTEISCHSRQGDPSHPNSPVRFGPWKVRSRILQPESPEPPCSGACGSAEAHCICRIETGSVREAVRMILEGTATVYAAGEIERTRGKGEVA